MSADYCSAMLDFLASKASAKGIGVRLRDGGSFAVTSPREGSRFAALAREYGWTVHPQGVQWSYQWYGWPEPDEAKAEQLDVLTRQIGAHWGTPLAEYGTHSFRAGVTVA